MTYYNEFDAKAAAWLRELVKAGLIPAGEVDERDVTVGCADDLAKWAARRSGLLHARLEPDLWRWAMGYPQTWDACGVTAMQSCRKSRKRS